MVRSAPFDNRYITDSNRRKSDRDNFLPLFTMTEPPMHNEIVLPIPTLLHHQGQGRLKKMTLKTIM